MITFSDLCDELIHFTESNLLEGSIDLKKETPLSSVGIDSYAIVELVLFIERKYAIEFSDEQLKPEIFENIEKLAAVVHTELRGE